MTSESDYADTLKAVERGDNSAKTKMAWLLLSGNGGADTDEDKAVALLEERVKDRDSEAMWMLGLCNEYGIGTEQDVRHAESLYKQSSERGNAIGFFFADETKNPRRGGGILRNIGSQITRTVLLL